MFTKKDNKGFTLIELLLVVALIILIGGISAPVYNSFQIRNGLDLATEDVVFALRRAQLLSQAMEGDSSWGVRIEGGSVIIFKGSSFALRDSSFDESTEFSIIINSTGVNEVVYSKLSGEPQGAVPITITLLSSDGEGKNIIVNSKGMVEY